MGRHSEYNEDTANAICDRLSAGESLLSIISDDDMPVRSTIYKWLREQKTFSDNYARARDEQADHFAEMAVEESRAIDDAAAARVRIDTLKWAAGQMKPGKWGPRKIVDDGPERAARKKSSDEVHARILELASGGRPRDDSDVPGAAPLEESSDEFSILHKNH